MSRSVVLLAIESGIAPSVWWAEDERDLLTALDALGKERERHDKANARERDDRRGLGG